MMHDEMLLQQQQQQQHGQQRKMWNTAEIQQFYANFAKQYDHEIEHVAHDDVGYPSPTILGQWAVQWLNERQHLLKVKHTETNGHSEHAIRVLDLGCGTGQSSAALVT